MTFLSLLIFNQRKPRSHIGNQTSMHSTRGTQHATRSYSCKRHVTLKTVLFDMESMVRNPIISSWVNVMPLPVTLLSHQKKRLTNIQMNTQVSQYIS